jgi:hypothetical protein
MQVDAHHFPTENAQNPAPKRHRTQLSHQATHDIGIHAVMLHQSTTSAGVEIPLANMSS